ncbi:hypothetical protein AC579_4792 [Pseudocercospora musae]|uniref:DUF7770 domain-containing protein n=1 Tax=Pseudocercospora musae TaxID=113226 RepID=A0A139H7U7_9PEZI|nr:hypothetical protein AC579_4792 [Pseudocercospora musae]
MNAKARIVRKVRVTIHNTGAHESSSWSENHVSIYLLVDNGQAVQFNMRTSEDGYVSGSLKIDVRTYQTSNTAIRSIDFLPLMNFTPNDLQARVQQFQLGGYDFTPGGVGCRYYSIIIASLMAQMGWLPRWAPSDLLMRLPFKRSLRVQGGNPWRIYLGTFDAPSTQTWALQMWALALQGLPSRRTQLQQAISKLRFIVSNLVTQYETCWTYIQELQGAGFWDGEYDITSVQQIPAIVQRTVSECMFLAQNVDRIPDDHERSTQEGIALANKRRAEDEEAQNQN